MTPHSGEVSALAWSPDGELLASVSTDRRIKVWNPHRLGPDATPRWERVGHPSEINHTQFSPNGTELYTCGTEGTVRVWDAADGRPLRETKPDDPLARVGPVNAFTLSLDGQQIAWGGGSMFGAADVVVGRAAELVATRRLAGHTRAIAIIAAYDGGWVSGGADRTVRFWDTETGRCGRTLRMPEIVRGLSVTREGTLLAGSAGSLATLWELPRAEEGGVAGSPPRERHLRGHTGQIESLELSPDGNLLATAALDGTLRVWDVPAGEPIRVFDLGLGPLHWVTFAPDRLTLAFSSHEGHVGLLDIDH